MVLNGLFKNNTFVPDCVVPIPDGTRVTVSVEESTQETDPKIVQQKKAWHDFFEGIRTLDEKLPVEFDEIVEKGMVFNQADFS